MTTWETQYVIITYIIWIKPYFPPINIRPDLFYNFEQYSQLLLALIMNQWTWMAYVMAHLFRLSKIDCICNSSTFSQFDLTWLLGSFYKFHQVHLVKIRKSFRYVYPTTTHVWLYFLIDSFHRPQHHYFIFGLLDHVVGQHWTILFQRQYRLSTIENMLAFLSLFVRGSTNLMSIDVDPQHRYSNEAERAN